MINGIDRGQTPCDGARTIDLASWAGSGVPLLGAPREFVAELHQRHLPQPGTNVLAVLDRQQRVIASASFTGRPHATDGWHHRNAILAELRRIIPHDLRLPAPIRTAVLLHCREGGPDWTEQDGPWMWALRDASALHGLRCGAYLTLTPAGWHSVGDGRSGRDPHSGSWAEDPATIVTELSSRAAREAEPDEWPLPVTVVQATAEQAGAGRLARIGQVSRLAPSRQLGLLSPAGPLSPLDRSARRSAAG
ncbi:hypothetical protein [Kitasatospora sp. NPDC094015]|uniref:hypothetical protein n=1 Tax=Kitasatospora sp. NPDC094015 TaxID=3155205 RepID=UPI00331B949D